MMGRMFSNSLKQAGKMRNLMIIAFATVLLSFAEGKVFTECDMVKELLNQGLQKNELSKWMCLIKKGSNFDTMYEFKNPDGTTEYGLFHINEKYCAEGTNPGKLCQMTCKSFLTDDITLSMKCALLIKKQFGFKGFTHYEMCKGHKLEDYSHCF